MKGEAMKIEFKTACELDEIANLFGFAEAIFESFCETYISPKDKSELINAATYNEEYLSNLFFAGKIYLSQALTELKKILENAEQNH